MNKQAKLELLKAYYNFNGLTLTWSEVEQVQRIASKAQKEAENLCKVQDYQKQYDKNHARQWDKLKMIFQLQLSPKNIELGGDPRGYCLKITTNNGAVICPQYFN